MKRLMPFSLFMFLLTTAATALAGTPIDKTVNAKPGGDVHIASVSGSVKVTTWDRNQVHVGGTLSADARRLEVQSDDGGVSIRVVLPHDVNHNEGSHLVVQVPAQSHLGVDTVSADVSAEGLTGPVRLQTVSGDVGLESKSADIETQSVSGDVRVRGSAPQARIASHSISGDVHLAGLNGELQAESVSGDIELEGDNAITRARVNSTSGDVNFNAALAADGTYDFHSVSGNVTLDLPKVPDARFDVSTFSGDIDTTFGPEPQRKSEYGPGKTWNFEAGSGSGRVNINTMSGDVELRAPRS